MSQHAPATADEAETSDVSDRTGTDDADLDEYVEAASDHWRTLAVVLLCGVLAAFGLVSQRAPFGYAPVFLGVAAVLGLYVFQSMDVTRDLRRVV